MTVSVFNNNFWVCERAGYLCLIPFKAFDPFCAQISKKIDFLYDFACNQSLQAQDVWLAHRSTATTHTLCGVVKSWAVLFDRVD